MLALFEPCLKHKTLGCVGLPLTFFGREGSGDGCGFVQRLFP